MLQTSAQRLDLTEAPFDDLEFAYLFDESGSTVIDETGIYNGDYNNGATWVAGGYDGGGAYTDGTNDFISTGFAKNYGTTGSFTISTWIKTVTSNTDIDVTYGSLNEGSGNRAIVQVLFYDSGCGDGNISLGMREAFGSGAIANVCATNNHYDDGNWHHVAFAFDSSANDLIVFEEGVETASVSGGTITDGAINLSDTAFYIGARNSAGSANLHLNAYFDEFMVFDRVLTDAEVTKLYTLSYSNTPTLDLNAVDGYPDTSVFPVFNYDSDGNLTIDFNVMDMDNDRLFLDLNYSTSQTQGTGTVIVQDLNLTSDYCVDLNFSQSSGVACSIDFNIHQSLVADGNYYLIGVIDDNYWHTDFNALEHDFAVDNVAGTTCLDNGLNQDWVINEACHFKDTTINIGTGILYITESGLIGLDNSNLLCRKINYQRGTSNKLRIQFNQSSTINFN